MLLKKKLRDLISKGNVAQSISILMELPLADQNLKNEIIQLSGQYYDLEKQENRKNLTREEVQVRRNGIRRSILALIDDLHEEGIRLSEQEIDQLVKASLKESSIAKKRSYYILKILSLLILLLIVSLFYISRTEKATPTSSNPTCQALKDDLMRLGNNYIRVLDSLTQLNNSQDLEVRILLLKKWQVKINYRLQLNCDKLLDKKEEVVNLMKNAKKELYVLKDAI